MTRAAKNKQRVFHYFDSIASDYESHVARGPLQWLRTRERKAVLSLLDLSSVPGEDRRFLDAGCGQGFYARFAHSQGFRVTAIDASPAMVEEVRAFADHAEVADIENWNTRERYDRIVCAGVLDFVTDPERSARRLIRLLKPDGKLILLLPRRGFGGWLYQAEKKLQRIEVNLFDLAWAHRLARDTGMTLTQVLYPLPANFALQFSYSRPRLSAVNT